jgi:hypothetical protein
MEKSAKNATAAHTILAVAASLKKCEKVGENPAAF